MRIGIIQFPGSNCERETMLAVRRAGMEPVEFLWNEPRVNLRNMDGFILVGGFSYEDRSRAGIIAALDPVMQEIKLQSEQGKPVLGICNGAQILVETGLVPGLENQKVGMALTENKRIANNKILGTGYYNAWVNMRLSDEYQRNAYTRKLSRKTILPVPVAHGEGRFVMTPALLQEVVVQGLNVFQYCDANGNIHDEFPTNPNGSMLNIAAISNKAGNVMAIMPHPERTPHCDAIFQSMRDYIAERKEVQTRHVNEVVPLYYYPRKKSISPYQKPPHSTHVTIELMITDNQALTVQNTLQQMGFKVKVTRQVQWEIICEPQEKIIEAIKRSGILFNDRKEKEVQIKQVNSRISFLVRAKEDLIGKQTQQRLQDHFGISTGLHAISHGVLWHFDVDASVDLRQWKETLLSTNIIANPYAHDCYDFTFKS